MNRLPDSPRVPGPDAGLKIYLLPNLFTAGNLFCGFLALTKIVEADPAAANFNSIIRHAIFLIILACVCDLLDGRVARMGGYESPFGREFDSLADIISFGAAPAFLVHRIVLRDVFVAHPEVGWFLASIYLICGALRLARFNCLTAEPDPPTAKGEFVGFPIPAAAGVVASLTLFMIWLSEHGWLDERFERSRWRYLLPAIMVFLSLMMVSEVKYPSFKKIDWRTRRTFTKTVIIVLLIGLLVIAWRNILPVVLPLFFTAYLIYGFVRPRLSRQMVQNIEDEDEEEGAGP